MRPRRCRRSLSGPRITSARCAWCASSIPRMRRRCASLRAAASRNSRARLTRAIRLSFWSGCLFEKFLQRVPVILVPANRQMFSRTVGKAGVVEGEFGTCTVVGELEFHKREFAWLPALLAPHLDQSRIGHEFEKATDNVAAEQRERLARS